jgi:putative membrane-bound dehydrogenase-like protein
MAANRTKTSKTPRPLFALLVPFVAILPGLDAAPLTLREDAAAHTLSVFRAGETKPLLTQNATPGTRPFLHPIAAPDGKGVLTELSPSHHPHQTGLYWGITRINGRDYFHNRGADYWRRIAVRPITPGGDEVNWATTYELLGADGAAVLRETQTWSMRESGGRYSLELTWTAEALTDITVGEYDYGGLFLRMPWRAGLPAEVVNSNRQRDARADKQRAIWLDAGVQVDGRTDLAHVTIFDHPSNNGYPLPWRVDKQFGVGPTRATLGEWKIAQGKSATFRHGFMIYGGTLSEDEITAAWKNYSGAQNDTVLWNLARDEGKKAPTLTPEQALAKMTVVPGFEARLTASEPMIEQPIAFCWDDRGRLWVAENRDYEARNRGFSNGAGKSRILILEDTDGDGRMDTSKVFLEGITFPSAMAVGFDGLWLGAPPNLLFVPDRNHDDRADTDAIEVRLTGWGIRDRHEVVNSLTWGPDGWLYGCQGYATPSQVGKPADGGKLYHAGEAFPANIAVKDPQPIDGGVWRYHPTKDRFEVVAHGFSNPWGLDFDDHGQAFITACVIPHLWHVIPGGIYHRQGGQHLNPHVYDDIKTIADHRHRSAHGGARIYLADEFPAEYRGRIFMANIHEHALLTDILEPRGSGFVGHHGNDALLANDPKWIGFSIETGPDGAVYMLDWHDADICGTAINDAGTGRIYRFAPKGLPGKTNLNLAALSDLQLVEQQTNRNDWYVRRARVLLQQRAAAGKLDAEVAPRLLEIFWSANTEALQLRALWALHVTNNLPADRLLALLDHKSVHVRAWAIQLLGEDRAPGEAALAKFAALAKSDPSPVVRLYLASALQRVSPAQRWAIAEGLLAHGEDATDHNLPKLIWFGVEPLVPADPARALALASQSRLALVSQFIARRATADKKLEAVVAALGAATQPAARLSLLEGLRDGLTALGRRAVEAPANWSAVEATLTRNAPPVLAGLLTQVGQFFGDAKATAAQLAALRDAATPADKRREVLAAFARDAYAPARDLALALLDDAALRRDALRALAAFTGAQVHTEILKRYATWPAADKAEAVLTLTARKPSADALVAQLKSNTIPRADISAYAARQLQRVAGPSFVDFWGPLNEPDEAKRLEIARLKRELTDATLARANLKNGRAVFDRTCAACHTLYDQGGKIGPDLTGSNRANLDYILSEIVNPSEVIQAGYELVTITTRDGRTLAGNVSRETDQQLTLRLIGQETVVPKSEILSRDKSPVSMMPEGLLKTLTPEEVRDLIAYLRTTAQVN